MTYVIVENGVVVHVVSVNDLQSLYECYPVCLILPLAGEEDVGWTYADGVFTPPAR